MSSDRPDVSNRVLNLAALGLFGYAACKLASAVGRGSEGLVALGDAAQAYKPAIAQMGEGLAKLGEAAQACMPAVAQMGEAAQAYKPAVAQMGEGCARPGDLAYAMTPPWARSAAAPPLLTMTSRCFACPSAAPRRHAATSASSRTPRLPQECLCAPCRRRP